MKYFSFYIPVIFCIAIIVFQCKAQEDHSSHEDHSKEREHSVEIEVQSDPIRAISQKPRPQRPERPSTSSSTSQPETLNTTGKPSSSSSSHSSGSKNIRPRIAQQLHQDDKNVCVSLRNINACPEGYKGINGESRNVTFMCFPTESHAAQEVQQQIKQSATVDLTQPRYTNAKGSSRKNFSVVRNPKECKKNENASTFSATSVETQDHETESPKIVAL